MMNYQDALDYIFSFVDYSRTHMENLAPENFDLGRVRDLLAKLGNPHRQYKVIHVAGSKGKGSVAAMCASILQKAGYKTGLNTSPHLEDFCERIKIDGQEIAEEEVIAVLNDMKPAIESMEFITTFEIITALAMLYFAQQNVDYVCFEVGLGGRLDASNVVTPMVSVITSISYEHTAILGETLTEIAGEKAGIIKPGVPVVSSGQVDEVRDVFDAEAKQNSAPIIYSSDEYDYKILSSSLAGQKIQVSEKESGDHEITFDLPLIGDHQAENALTAYAVLQELIAQGENISRKDIERGFANVDWPGRLETIYQYPLVVVDGAHNPDSARRLADAIDTFLPGKEICLIVGFSGDKDLSGILQPILPKVKTIVASQAIHPRAMPPVNIENQLKAMGVEAIVAGTIEEAFDAAFQRTGECGVVLVTGSLFMVGAAKSAIRAMG